MDQGFGADRALAASAVEPVSRLAPTGCDHGERLVALAEQCETTMMPDREIDRMIWIATDPQGYSIWESGQRAMLNRDWDEPRRQVTLQARAKIAAEAFTGSLDAAMTLVPEGWNWLAQSNRKKFGLKPSAQCWPDGEDRRTKTSEASTPALALCAAALRAKAANHKPE